MVRWKKEGLGIHAVAVSDIELILRKMAYNVMIDVK